MRRARFIDSGQKYMVKSEYEAASIQFRRAAQVDPTSAEAHYDLALSLGKLGRWQESYRELQATTQIDPRNVPGHLATAEMLAGMKQFDAARREIDLVLQIEPDNYDAHLLAGNTWLAQQQYKSALEEFDTCQRLKPDKGIGFVQAGAVYLRRGTYDDAVRVLNQAIEADAAFVPGYVYLAEAHRLQNNPEAEIAALLNGIQHNPKQSTLYLITAEAYLKLGDNEKIGPLFEQLRAHTSDSLAVLTVIGDFYFRAGDGQQAKKIFSAAMGRDPKNDLIKRRLIEVALNQQDWDYAEKLNDELLAQKPKDVEARLFEARLQFARGARAKAIASLQRLVHDSPELPLPHFYLGLAYAGQGQSAQAVSAFNDALQKDPDFIWAYVDLGQLYLQQGSGKLALDFADQALKRNAAFLPARLLEATALIQTGDTDTAVQKLRSLLASDSSNSAVLEKLGVALATKKDYKGAEDEFEAALASDPKFAPALVDLLRVYGVEKHPERMIARVQLQNQRAPGQSRFYEILGDLEFSNKKLEAAADAYSTAAKLNDNSAVAWMGLSRTHAAEGKLSDGINDARKLLDLHPDYMVGYVQLGQLLEQSGDFSNAEQTYQRALERNDDYAPALNNLAWLYCEHGGNLDMALSLGQKAKSKFPVDPAISDTLGWIEYRKGLYDSAASSLKDVIDHVPQNGLYQYHYGMILWKLQRPQDARQALQRALQLSVPTPQADNAKSVLAELSSGAGPKPDQLPVARN